jgi:FkbM family methyltransferase
MNLSEYINTQSPIDIALRTFLHKGESVIFDIGACEGEDSIRYYQMFPHARIYSFEPLPANLQKINENFIHHSVLDRATVVPFALSDEDGPADFFVSEGAPPEKLNSAEWNYGNKSSSLLGPAIGIEKEYAWLAFKEKIKVERKRLDGFCRDMKIDTIDFIHMDVQGAELHVLRGAGEFLHRIRLIWLEVENVELYASQPLKQEVQEFMKEHGFIKLKDTVDSVSGDQLYINERINNGSRMILFYLRSFFDRIKNTLAKK